MENVTGFLLEKLDWQTSLFQKAEFWGLVLFVGVPLPGTGGWTGSLIASLLNVRFLKALVAIFLGLLLATGIMSAISYGIPWVISLFGG